MKAMLVAAGEEIGSAESFAAWKTPDEDRVTAVLYGGELTGCTIRVPPVSRICVCSEAEYHLQHTVVAHVYTLALHGEELEKWVRTEGHHPYER